ncbi:DUF2920 family protein [Lysinibacillus sp. FSL L8-0312]|uniref:DUF2920 family protein n=1 Tax=Lysinibacillus sp. FSL L8-0312 TaxID=2921521 RepID=UPI0030F73394
MSYNDTLKIPAHYNIYTGVNGRELRIDYSIPQKGTNADTGIFIFVPGFGGHIDSKIYKKMREHFAEKYNVVTVQCDYFGSRFMQSSDSFRLKNDINIVLNQLTLEDQLIVKNDTSTFINIISKYNINLPVHAVIDESIDEFVDMGYMQSIDVITAIEAIKILLSENSLEFDEGRILGFGQSQGAYILLLANRLVPHLFSQIIDNAAWVEPQYLYNNRSLINSVGNAIITFEFEYLAKRVVNNKKSLSLHNIYNGFENGSFIYSCLGVTDVLVDVQDKERAIGHIKNLEFEVIDNKDVDGTIFKSTNHGLDADFINLIDYALAKKTFHRNTNMKQFKYIVNISKTKLSVDYSNGLPIFQFVNS